MSRKIIIGDTHGCSAEFAELLKKCEFRPGHDKLFMTGDLINRGPDSVGCYRLAQEHNARCVMGNHEWGILKAASGATVSSDRLAKLKHEFGARGFSDYLTDIAQWPFWLETDEFLLVHAGLAPGKTPQECDKETLITIRQVADPAGSGSYHPWFAFYTQTKPVVFGHWAQLGGHISETVLGIDMGCVYGRSLRAVIFPEKTIVEIPAKEVYYNSH